MKLRLDSSGLWLLEGVASEPVVHRCLEAGRNHGNAGLILQLALETPNPVEDPSCRWLGTLGQELLRQVCLLTEDQGIPSPGNAWIETQLANTPLFDGSHHLSSDLIRQWWEETRDHLHQLTEQHPRGRSGWLQDTAPGWHQVGRVIFHLAENATDAERPFAFLATFTEHLNEEGEAKHLPLARALQQHAGQAGSPELDALLTPVRRAAENSPWLREQLRSKQLFQPQAWTPEQAYPLLEQATILQQAGILTRLPDWWQPRKRSRAQVQIQFESPGRLGLDAMLRFRIERSLDGSPLTEKEWERIQEVGTGLVSLRGRWVEVHAARLEEALHHWQRVAQLHQQEGVPFHLAMRWLAGAPTDASEDSIPSLPVWTEIRPDAELAEALQRLSAPLEVPPPPDLQATLRPYQKVGFHWLEQLSRLGLGACLADDMGLGKTLQVIALLLHRRRKRILPSLVVAPASLIGNWKAELQRFAPSLDCLFLHRSMLDTQDLQRWLGADQIIDHDVVVTSYHQLLRSDSLAHRDWDLVVLDEAQTIKNPSAATTTAVKQLRSKGRIALTGTPVENHAGDLWSLFDFLHPGLLGDAPQFHRFLRTTPEAFSILRRMLAPFLLRRMKTDPQLLPDLPSKTEVEVESHLTRRQATIYAKMVEQLASMLRNPQLDDRSRRGEILGFLTRFKQICNHPSQWNGDGQWEAKESGKFQRLKELAEQFRDRGDRVLVFTQFRETCQPLARLLESVWQRSGLVLHGGTPVAKRQQHVETFQKRGGPPFMVISLKAGGTGLNLTAANQVVHFDRWWNPAVERQATDRAFRIGQHQPVLVHQFVCSGTIEERIHRMLSDKQQLAAELIQETPGETLLQLPSEQLMEAFRLSERSGFQNE